MRNSSPVIIWKCRKVLSLANNIITRDLNSVADIDYKYIIIYCGLDALFIAEMSETDNSYSHQ